MTITITTVVTLLLSSAVVSGVVTTCLTYVFDIQKNKTSRNFELKKEAYMKAVASISGASHTIFDYFLKKHKIDGRINPMVVTEFVAAHTRELAPAILVANNEIKNDLEQFAPLIIEGADVLEKVHNAVEKTKSGYVAGQDTTEAKLLVAWKEKVESLENKIIQAMQKDLGLR